jgi:hypothetical protein
MVESGGGFWAAFLVFCVGALFLFVGWYAQKSAEVIVTPTTPSPTPATASCTIVNASGYTTGGMTAEVVVHTTRCGVNRAVHVAGLGDLDTAAAIELPADTIAAGDLPFFDTLIPQLFTTHVCMLSLGDYGVDLQVFGRVYADGSIQVLSSIVNDDTALNPAALGANWVDVVNGFPEPYTGSTGYLVCDMTWISAVDAAAAASSTSVAAAASHFGIAGKFSPAAMAAAKAKIRARTWALPKPRRIVPRSTAVPRPPVLPRVPSRRP